MSFLKEYNKIKKSKTGQDLAQFYVDSIPLLANYTESCQESKKTIANQLSSQFRTGENASGIEICEECNEPFDYSKGTYICTRCGTTRATCVDERQCSFQEAVIVFSSYEYSKKLRFLECLRSLQGKGGKVPNEIVDKVAAKVDRYRIPRKKLTDETVKIILKELKLQSYYDNRFEIRDRIAGESGEILTADDEAFFTAEFCKLEKAFEQCKKTRKNFYKYTYAIRRIAEKKKEKYGWILNRCPELKNEQNKRNYDELHYDLIKAMKADEETKIDRLKANPEIGKFDGGETSTDRTEGAERTEDLGGFGGFGDDREVADRVPGDSADATDVDVDADADETGVSDTESVCEPGDSADAADAESGRED